MRVVAFFMAVLLFGCAEPQVVYQPFEVKVPIDKPCKVDMPPEPAYATDSGMPVVDPDTGKGIDVATKKLQAERLERKAYIDKLKTAANGCR